MRFGPDTAESVQEASAAESARTIAVGRVPWAMRLVSPVLGAMCLGSCTWCHVSWVLYLVPCVLSHEPAAMCLGSYVLRLVPYASCAPRLCPCGFGHMPSVSCLAPSPLCLVPRAVCLGPCPYCLAPCALCFAPRAWCFVHGLGF